jgi:N-acetylmuramoyl-L-alanine amidase
MRWSNGAMRTINTACAIFISGCVAWGQAAPTPIAPPSSPAPTEKPLLVLIDPAHGGSDPGALLTPSVSEKEVTLAVARRLREELTARGILCQLLRDNDSTLTTDQRAAIANGSGPALYIALHASSLGSGVRVFTALLPAGGDDRGPFLNWDTAQAATLARSRAIQALVVAAVQKTRFPTRALSAPLAPLSNLQPPALAIEISPTTGDASQLASAGYQQMICAAVANAIASIAPSLRTGTGSHP